MQNPILFFETKNKRSVIVTVNSDEYINVETITIKNSNGREIQNLIIDIDGKEKYIIELPKSIKIKISQFKDNVATIILRAKINKKGKLKDIMNKLKYDYEDNFEEFISDISKYFNVYKSVKNN